jgi:hypothetical protein
MQSIGRCWIFETFFMRDRENNSAVRSLPERYLSEARKFTEAMDNPSSKELNVIRRNIKEILKQMIQEKNNRPS